MINIILNYSNLYLNLSAGGYLALKSCCQKPKKLGYLKNFTATRMSYCVQA